MDFQAQYTVLCCTWMPFYYENIAFSVIVAAILSTILSHNNDMGVKTKNYLFNIVYSVNWAF